MNKAKIICDHTWIKSGFWDGKTPDGKKTGGVIYKCTKCSEKTYSRKGIQEKGGTLNDLTNVSGVR